MTLGSLQHPLAISMKYLPLLIVPLVLYVVGLMSGPMIGSMIVKEAVVNKPLEKEITIGDFKFPINLAEMRDHELPETVETVGQVKLPVVSGDGEKSLASGRKVKLLNRNGNKLIVETTDGLAKGEVDLSQTDIFAAIARKKMSDNLAAAAANSNSSTPQPPAPKPPVVANNTTPQPVQPTPEPVMPEPKPADPEPALEPEPAAASLTPEKIVEVMQQSIKDGAVKVFTFDKVTAWKATEDEEFDGDTYQTGLALYKAVTIFGEKDVEAKALIKNGKVVKWLYANTGMEIPKGK